MSEQTKNVGQIAAIWINSIAPENQRLIWYDTVDRVHKVYQQSTGTWVALNSEVVTESTIAVLTTIAQGDGLSVGKFYYLTDVGTLAIAITTTKVWYVDSHSNYVVNDLAGSIQAYVNSTNLLIDGATGVWENGQLKFSFTTYTAGSSLQSDADYVVLRRKTGSVWSWVKCKLQGLISAVSGNSITWNNGLFFNFNNALNAKKNTAGGVVSWEQHNTDKNQLQSEINAATEANQDILDAAKTYTDNHTNEAYIYNTLQHSSSWTLINNPAPVPSSGSTLHTILNIILSWINLLKKSSNILVGSGFNPIGRTGNVNYSDTVRSALEKLVYKTVVELVIPSIIVDVIKTPHLYLKRGWKIQMFDVNNDGQTQMEFRVSDNTLVLANVDKNTELHTAQFAVVMGDKTIILTNRGVVPITGFDYSGVDAEIASGDTIDEIVEKLISSHSKLRARPYINETTWHAGTRVSWIIRDNVLFMRLTRMTLNVQVANDAAAEMDEVDLGDDFLQYIQIVFNILPWTYNKQSSTRTQKFIKLWSIGTGDVGLCISRLTNSNDGSETWTARLGYHHYEYVSVETYVNIPLSDEIVSLPLSF